LEYGWGNGLGARSDIIVYQDDIRYAQLGLVYRWGGRAGLAQSDESLNINNEQALELPRTATSEPEHIDTLSDTLAHVKCDWADVDVKQVNFAVDSAHVDSDAGQRLESLVQFFTNCDTQGVTVIGHTDSTGSRAYNQRLSLQRAESVANYLEALGLNVDGIKTEAFGEDKPLAENETESGRATNRRVELVYPTNLENGLTPRFTA